VEHIHQPRMHDWAHCRPARAGDEVDDARGQRGRKRLYRKGGREGKWIVKTGKV
jgi:hypothetical protein